MMNRTAIEAAVKHLARNGTATPSGYVSASAILSVVARAEGHAKGYDWTRRAYAWRNAGAAYCFGKITLAELRGWDGCYDATTDRA